MNNKYIQIILFILIVIAIGYFIAKSNISITNQGARSIESQDIKNQDPYNVGKQNLNCKGLGVITFETPPQAGVPGASVNVTVAGASYQCEWGAIY